MAQEGKIRTNTVVEINSNGQGRIETAYAGSDSNILKCMITDSVGVRNGVRHKEGELMVSMTNYPNKIDAAINTKGELVLMGKDLNKYSISPDGDLLYTYEE